MSNDVLERYCLSKDAKPVYQQLAGVLENIIHHEYQPNDYLPSEHILAAHYGVNRHTVRRATDELIAAGLVIRQRGKGVMILHSRPSNHTGLPSAQCLDHFRDQSSSIVLSHQVVLCDSQVAGWLNIAEFTPVFVIETLRVIDGEPVSWVKHYLNCDYVPHIDEHYQEGSLHSCIAKVYGIDLVRSSLQARALMPSREEAVMLKMPMGSPVLQIESFNVMASAPDKVVEVSVAKNCSDRFVIKL